MNPFRSNRYACEDAEIDAHGSGGQHCTTVAARCVGGPWNSALFPERQHSAEHIASARDRCKWPARVCGRGRARTCSSSIVRFVAPSYDYRKYTAPAERPCVWIKMTSLVRPAAVNCSRYPLNHIYFILMQLHFCSPFGSASSRFDTIYVHTFFNLRNQVSLSETAEAGL